MTLEKMIQFGSTSFWVTLLGNHAGYILQFSGRSIVSLSIYMCSLFEIPGGGVATKGPFSPCMPSFL